VDNNAVNKPTNELNGVVNLHLMTRGRDVYVSIIAKVIIMQMIPHQLSDC